MIKPVYEAKWQSGSRLLASSLTNGATAILAMKDMSKGNYFIVPEIFSFDQNIKNFVGEELGKIDHWNYWYMLEDELLVSLRNAE